MRLLLSVALLAPLCACGSEDVREPLRSRDVIVVVADSFAAGHSSLYGYDRPTTPVLEALAREGVTVESAYSQTSWTLSSVLTLFTGLEQEAHGVLRSDQRLDDERWVLAEAFRQRGYKTQAFIQNGAVGKVNGAARGFDEFVTLGYTGLGDEFAQAVCDYLERPSAAPRFVYIHFAPPHMPYAAPEEFQARFRDEAGAPEITGTIIDTAVIARDGHAPDSSQVRKLVDLYDAHVAYADKLIGDVVDAAHGTTDSLNDALLLVLSDHGEAFMQHGATGHNAHVYEEMVHVPMVFVAPGADAWFRPGSRLAGPVTMMDVAPTLCQLFDMPAPPEAVGSGVFGRENVSLLAERDVVLSSRYPREDLPQVVDRAIRSGDWKLVTGKRGGPPELYDLAEDPEELVNLAERHPEKVSAMLERLSASVTGSVTRGRRAGRVELTSEAKAMLRSLGYTGYIEGVGKK